METLCDFACYRCVNAPRLEWRVEAVKISMGLCVSGLSISEPALVTDFYEHIITQLESTTYNRTYVGCSSRTRSQNCRIAVDSTPNFMSVQQARCL